MKLQIESFTGSPYKRTYRSVPTTLTGGDQVLCPEVQLSESSQVHFFAAPFPTQPREKDLRQLRLVGEKGEALVRKLCAIHGVTQVLLGHSHVSVIVRENGHLSWPKVEGGIFVAFAEIFANERVLEWYVMPPAA